MPSAPEPLIRGAFFFGALLTFGVAEHVWPRRRRVAKTAARWLTNGGIIALDTALIRALAAAAPLLSAVGAASFAHDHGFGLFAALHWPYWVQFAVTLLAFDFAVWFQHLVFHQVPVLWRLHRVHHADRDLDVSSALRFHPIEIAISAFYKAALAVALGAPVAAIVAFEITLNACAMFNHANTVLPKPLDAVLRLVLVTPDTHRIHHSIHRDEHDQNYGFCLSVWDRLFGVYRAAPRGGQEGMTIGLADWQDARPSRFFWSLAFPFMRK